MRNNEKHFIMSLVPTFFWNKGVVHQEAYQVEDSRRSIRFGRFPLDTPQGFVEFYEPYVAGITKINNKNRS